MTDVFIQRDPTKNTMKNEVGGQNDDSEMEEMPGIDRKNWVPRNKSWNGLLQLLESTDLSHV